MLVQSATAALLGEHACWYNLQLLHYLVSNRKISPRERLIRIDYKYNHLQHDSSEPAMPRVSTATIVVPATTLHESDSWSHVSTVEGADSSNWSILYSVKHITSDIAMARSVSHLDRSDSRSLPIVL